jgi:hypothetical protein
MFILCLTNATVVVFRWLSVTLHSLSHYLYNMFRAFKVIPRYFLYISCFIVSIPYWGEHQFKLN